MLADTEKEYGNKYGGPIWISYDIRFNLHMRIYVNGDVYICSSGNKEQIF